MLVPIIIASKQDQEQANKIIAVLAEFDIEYKVHIASAHKVPDKVLKIVQSYQDEENVCFMTIAGLSNGLSGLVAANSVHPVIACPLFKDKADYLVNIHSSLQMPSGTPVLTVIDPKNAALAVARILGINNTELRAAIAEKIKDTKNSFSDAILHDRERM